MSTPTQTKPVDHGRIALPEPPTRETRWIPPELRRTLTFISDVSKMEAEYGLWKIRLSSPVYIRGKACKSGDTVELDGANAAMLVTEGGAEFLDPRKGQLEEMQAKLAKMNERKPMREVIATSNFKPAVAGPTFP